MSFLSKLNAAIQNPVSNHIKFLTQYKKNEKSLHLFFEGEGDFSFYTGFVQQLAPTYKLYYYLCEGKKNVFECYNSIQWSFYLKNRCLFFTDKDYDDFVGKVWHSDENIYETKYYSIENYVVVNTVLERFLREICHIHDDGLISEILAKFEVQLSVFVNSLQLLSAWIIYHRKINSKLNLNNIDLADIFCFNDELELHIKHHASDLIEHVENCTQCCTDRTDNEIWQEIYFIQQNLTSITNHKFYIRGKFEIWFLFAFCKCTVDRLIPNLNLVKTRKKYKVQIQLNQQNILQIIAPRLIIPDEVKEFIDKNIKSVEQRLAVHAAE